MFGMLKCMGGWWPNVTYISSPLPPIKKGLTQAPPVLLGFPGELENYIQATIPRRGVSYIFPPSPKKPAGWSTYIISPPHPPHP